MGNPVIFNGRRSKLLTVDGLVNSNNSKNDFDGEINYILNGHYEQVLTGTVTYADAAGALPVDGTGGSPSITIARSTTTPLRGQAHLLLTKPASNIQGNGFSIDFSIDSIDQGKLLSIGADVRLLSGTYNEGTSTTPSDLTVYVYDVTNAVLLGQLAEYRVLPNAINLGGKVQASFQTNVNSTSYRLIFHCATTSAAAYTLAVDNISVSPSVITRGALITDWQSYTPTFTGYGTPTNVEAFWRRVGDSVELDVKFTTGTTTSTECRVSLPNGIVSKTWAQGNKVAGAYGRGIATTVHGGFVLAQSNVAYVCFSDSGVFSNVSVNALNTTTSTSGNSELLAFQAIVPIAGWSSSQQLSSDAGTRLITAKYRCTTADTTTSTNAINYDTRVWDSHAAVTTGATNWTFTAPQGDYYNVTVGASYASGGNSGAYVYVNGVLVDHVTGASATLGSATNGSTKVFLNAGQTVDIRNGSGTSSTLTADATLNYIIIDNEKNEQQLASSDKISFQARKSTTQSIPNNTLTTVTNWTNTDIDSTNSFNATTGVYTVQRAGLARINANINWTPNVTGARVAAIVLNGTVVSQVETIGALGTNTSCLPYYLARVAAGDLIRVDAFQNSGGALDTIASLSKMIFSVEIS